MNDASRPPDRELETFYDTLRHDALSAAQVRSLEAKLAPLLGPPPGSGSTDGGSTGGGLAERLRIAATSVGARATLLLLGAAAVLSVVLSVVLPEGAEREPGARDAAEAPARPSRVATPEVRDAEQKAAVEPVAPPATPVAAPATESAHRERRRLDEGAELLRDARARLSSDPPTTLALTGEHRRRYPRGILSLERELLAIDALVALDRRAEAAVIAHRLLTAAPDDGRLVRRLARHGLVAPEEERAP